MERGESPRRHGNRRQDTSLPVSHPSPHDGEGPGVRSAALLVALALDLIGEPPAAMHPVVGYGKLIRWLERRAPNGDAAQLRYGVGMVLVALPAAILPAVAVERSATEIRGRLARRGLPLAGNAA